MTRGMSKGTTRALIEAPADGVLKVEYSVGLAIKRRGWAEEISSRSGDDGGRFPRMTLRLNQQGREAAELLQYQTKFAETKAQIPALEESGANLFHLSAEAHAELSNLEGQGFPTAGHRGYLDALQSRCRELVM